jgi:plasmid segregation protein ParM
MKSDTPVVVDVRAVDVGYFSTKLSLGRRYDGGKVAIGTHIFPSLAPRLPAGMSPKSALNSRPDGTVVEVDGVNYFVGRDAVLYSSGREPRSVLADYCLSDKYMALLRGALHYISKDVGNPAEMLIKHLVVGLPLSTFATYQAKLQARLAGEHLLPDPSQPEAMRRVTVGKVSVIVQPQGALVHHSLQNSRVVEGSSWSLVVDAGGGTLDWFLARGRQPNWQRSGAYAKSMLACSYAVADRINAAWRDNYEIIDRIDTALRNGVGSFTTGGDVYELAQHRPDIDAVLKESTSKMLDKVESLDNLDTMLFTGGGAPVFLEFMKRTYPHKAKIMYMDSDPVFANVKGFHLAGDILSSNSQ